MIIKRGNVEIKKILVASEKGDEIKWETVLDKEKMDKILNEQSSEEDAKTGETK